MIAQAFFGYAFSTFYLIPKYLAEALGAGPVEIGVVTTVHAGAAVVSLLTSGVLVDRFGRIPFLTGGGVLMALASWALLGVEEVGWLLYSLRTLQGLAFALAFSAGSTLCVDLAPRDRTAQAIGVFGATMLTTNAAATTLGEILADAYSWDVAFLVAGAAALMSCLLSFLIKAPPRAPARGSSSSSWLEVIFRRELLPIFGVIAIVGAAFGAMTTFQTPFALELGISQIRSFFVAYAATAVAVRILLGPVIDGWGHRRVALSSLALYAVTVAGMSTLQPGTLAWFGGVFGLAHGLFYPSFNAVAMVRASADERGKVMSFFQAWFSAGVALGSVLLGFLAESSGYASVFLCMGAVMGAGWVLLFLGVSASPGSVGAKRR